MIRSYAREDPIHSDWAGAGRAQQDLEAAGPTRPTAGSKLEFLQRTAGNTAVAQLLGSETTQASTHSMVVPLLSLQRTAGNAAVSDLLGKNVCHGGERLAPEPTGLRHPLSLQRCGPEPCGCAGHDIVVQRAPDVTGLMSPRFAGDPKLEGIHHKGSLKRHDKGEAVEKVQTALIDFGFPLPKFGADSSFGGETKEAVEAFQRAKGLTGANVDGKVGPITMDLLDKEALQHDSGPTPPPPSDTTRTVPKNLKLEQPDPQKAEKGEVKDEGKTELQSGTQQEVAPPPDKEPKGQLTVNLGGTIPWFSKSPPKSGDDNSLSPLCNNGVLQLGGKWNVNIIKVPGTSNKLFIFAEPELDFNFAPSLCGNRPVISEQMNVLKLKLNDAVELGLQEYFGVQGPPTGFAGGGGVILDVKLPIVAVPTKLELGLLGGALYVPEQHFTAATVTGGISIIFEVPVIH